MALALAAAGLARPAAADIVTVRSGEHPGFTRLVLDFDAVPRWSLSADGRTRRFAFSGPRFEVATDRVFERIGRGRIGGVAGGENSLDLELACDCAVTAYVLVGGRLVIDVGGAEGRRGAATGSAIAGAAFVSADDTPPNLSATGAPVARWVSPAVEAETTATLQDREDRSANRPETGDRRPPALGRLRPPDPPPALAASAAASAGIGLQLPRPGTAGEGPGAGSGPALWPDILADRRGGRDAAVEAVAEALDRATSQGLIDRAEEAAPPGPRTAEARAPAPDDLPLPVGQSPSIRVTTSLDRDLARVARTLQDNAGSDCLAGYDLDVASWGDPSLPLGGLTGRRSGLYGEFDKPDPDKALDLARGYIYVSFGAEARAVLRAVPQPADEMAVLQLLADVADDVVRRPDDELTALLACPGPAALWAFLALSRPPMEADVATAEIASAFSGLPLHLRRHYGPRLVERFLAMDDADAAREIWGAVDRAGGDHGQDFVLATAALTQAEGDVAAAEQAYDSLEDGHPNTAPLAVIRLISSRLDRGAPIDASVVDTAAALAFENRGTALARDLKLAELRGRIALGAWDVVFEELPKARFSGALSPEDADAVMSELYVAMAGRAGADAFLIHGAAAVERLPAGIEGDLARRRVAARFVDYGLPDRAGALLRAIVEPAPGDALLRARADILAGRYGEALSALGALETADAQVLRGEALLGEKRFVEAAAAFAAAGDSARAENAAVRSGVWDAGPEGVRSAAAALLTPRTPASEEAPLARNRALIDEADSLRDDIAALLSIAGASTETAR
ncbi:MAG: hypothetical protein QNJ13_10620 [Paracoccaceae bacterium]|nr:hypothetical protein [Paracoccaceae bacterium]